MSAKKAVLLGMTAVFCVLSFVGCGPQAELALNFEPDQAVSYVVRTEAIKDFEFVQPSANKRDVKQSGTRTELGYTMRVLSVDEKGNATAEIVVDSLKYNIDSKEGSGYSFDSSKAGDMSKPLANALGKSYTVKVTPAGRVSLIDSSDVISAVKGGQDARIAKSFFGKEAVEIRHSMTALPTSEQKSMKPGSTWTVEKSSPPGVLAPKTYELVYTLEKVENVDGSDVALITMTAVPGEETPSSKGQMGLFAKMFDTDEDYTGHMKLCLESGKVIEYDEKLKATYIAMEPGEGESGPDSLTMGFTFIVEKEMVK